MADRPRILIVDDEPDILEQIVELLESRYDLALARTFEYAVNAFNGRTPDLAILDIMGVNGEELLARFHRDVPCIMLTAHSLTPESLKRTAAAGARLYLPKDELLDIGDYIDEVLSNPGKPLWAWLLERVSYRQWFGAAWSEEDEKFLLGLIKQDMHDAR